jgi:hypothetical protein
MNPGELPTPEDAELLTNYYRLKQNKPPAYIAVYFPRSDGDFDFVAVVDMFARNESLRILAAIARTCRPDTPLLISVEAHDYVKILEFDPGRRSLSLRKLSRLYDDFALREGEFIASGRFTPFSEIYRQRLTLTVRS